MKNKFIKYILMSMLFLFAIFNTIHVKAEETTDTKVVPAEFIPNIFMRKERPNGYKKYQQARFIRQSSDNHFIYCLQPYADIKENAQYKIEMKDYISVLNLTMEQWHRISLLAYYGYNYNENGYNHSANKWYVITQLLIWRTVEPDDVMYFTDTLNGNKVKDKFADEIAELETLVANHDLTPNFNTKDINVNLGETIKLTDKNEVLKNFEIDDIKNAIASINENNLTITPTAVGNVEISFVKKATNYEMPPIVYFSDHSQNALKPGYYDPVYSQFSIKIIAGSIEIHKLDKDTNSSNAQGNAVLEGAVYEIFDTDYNLITTLVTDKNGYAKTDKILSLNKEYILKEKKASNGYLLDTEEHRFTLNDENLDISINVYEKVIERKVKIFKVLGSNKTGVLTPEPNINFEIYLKNCNSNQSTNLIGIDVDTHTEVNPYCLITTITTDKNGYASVTLPYGTYIFRQLNTTSNYEKVQDFEIIIDENVEDEITKVLSDTIVKGKLKLIKVDADSNKMIVKDGIKFKIKNTDTNEYVCQEISYPTKKNICTFETTDGYFITPDNLEIGNYQIEEVEDQNIDGYIINKLPIAFSINENSDFKYDGNDTILEIVFNNKQVKGELNITKIGEKFILDNGKFKYEEIKLNDVSFDLYADGDLYSQDGNLIYKDKEIITSFKTIDGFYKIENLYLGNYCLVETETALGHVLNDKPYCFKLEFKDSKTPIVSLNYTIKNFIGKGNVEITKTDISNSNALQNALIEIYNVDNELIFSGYTDSNGKIVVENLPIGKYKFIEKEAPSGYIINTEEHFFEIKENGEIVKSYLTNEKEPEETFDVPKTSVADSKIIDVITITLVIAGIGFVIYDKKKK